MQDRVPVEVDLAWESFHEVINMTSEELRAWLRSGASDEDEFPVDRNLTLPEVGRQVVELLLKRKVDLTQREADVMEQVVDFVLTQESAGPADTETDEQWRRGLMTVGHDPMRS
jgi:hypothetical protein